MASQLTYSQSTAKSNQARQLHFDFRTIITTGESASIFDGQETKAYADMVAKSRRAATSLADFDLELKTNSPRLSVNTSTLPTITAAPSTGRPVESVTVPVRTNFPPSSWRAGAPAYPVLPSNHEDIHEEYCRRPVGR